MKRDLTGQRFGRITALEDTGKRTKPGNNAIWLCRCDCGKLFEVRSSNLTTTKRPQKSCGCTKWQDISMANSTHGGSKKDRLYRVWMGMRRRCRDPRLKEYSRYGGRGIRVCDEWQDYAVFKQWADPSAGSWDCTLDRIDNNGNYEPSNCRWVDLKTQENNKRSNLMIEYQGRTMSLKMWSEELGFDYNLVRDRLRYGWTFERAITQPVQVHKSK